jgi:mono/diheme cytochrome c family protein
MSPGRSCRVARMRLRLAFLLVLGLLLAVAAGCGGGEEVTPTPDDDVPVATGGTDTGTETGGETETGGGTTDTGGETETGGGETETGGGGGGGNAEAGKEVFASAGCVSCHTLADAGASGTVGPNLDEAKPDEALVVDRVTNGAGAMPAFKDSLSEQQINDVAAYVSSVAGS